MNNTVMQSFFAVQKNAKVRPDRARTPAPRGDLIHQHDSR